MGLDAVFRIYSFSYRSGEHHSLGAGLVLDTRVLTNPFTVRELRHLDGRDHRVRAFVIGSPPSKKYKALIESAVNYAYDNPLDGSVAFGCVGGRHRSVACAHNLYHALRNAFFAHPFELQHLALKDTQ